MSVGVVLSRRIYMQGGIQVETVSLDVSSYSIVYIEVNSINLFICMVKNIMLKQC